MGIYTVGQMAELCNISRKQLRYYDQIGLLKPDFRDELTNYRYYTDKQIEVVLLIRELKELKIPLDTIGKLLERRNVQQMQAILQEHLTNLRREIEQSQRQYDRVVDILMSITTSSVLAYGPQRRSINLVDFPEKQVCFTRYVSSTNANKLFINRRAELLTLCEKYQLRTTGPNYAIFHSDYMAQFVEEDEEVYSDLEICFELARSIPSAGGEKYIRTIPAFKAVSCLFLGHYRDMKPAYRAMEDWAKENNLELSDCSLEEYLVGATNTSNSDDYITRLYIPLKGAEV